LDKDFLFKQRVWLLKSHPSISPADAGGENIWLEENENIIHRIKPRYNAEVNQWWISDDTRYSYKAVHADNRLRQATRLQYGAVVQTSFDNALEEAVSGLTRVVEESGQGSLYALLSPMMACEEAWLLGQYIRSLDPQAVLALGPVPTAGEDEVFHNYLTKKETFRIQAEKVPNAAGIRRVIQMLGGPSATFEEFAAGTSPELKKLKGGWIVGGYLSNWIPATMPALLKKGFRVVQDVLETSLSGSADIVLPAATWAEKDGCWENFQGKIQAFVAAIPPVDGTRREGNVYLKLLGRGGQYNATAIREEMGEPFASVKRPLEKDEAEEPAFEFAEL
jgi:NADH-quinone oxidoreductase subunit G